MARSRKTAATPAKAPAAEPTALEIEIPAAGAYGGLYGVNPDAVLLCAMLGGFGEAMTPITGIGRFRDVTVAEAPEGEGRVVIVLQRIGGAAHRMRFRATWEAIRAHPMYVADRDLQADPEYAVVTFRPDNQEALAGVEVGNVSAAHAFEQRVADLADATAPERDA